MATPVIENEDLELIRKLRAEWRKSWEEACEQRDQKGYIDPEARSKVAKVETDLNAKTDTAIAAMGKRIDEQDARIKLYGERGSRPPGGGDGSLTLKTLGQKFTEHDHFKNAQFTGRFQVQVGLTKTRIKEGKATTIVEGGATTITPPAGSYPIFPRRLGIVPQRFAPLTMRDLVDVIPLDGTNSVEYVTEVWDNQANYQVAEGDRKAQSGVTYADHTAVVRTIANFVKISRQMASDVSFIVATVENRLAQFVLLKEDKEILYGDNTAGHLWGIMPQATPATVYYPGPAPADATAIDQLNAAQTYVESQFYFPTAYVMHPTTWSQIESFKTSLGTYLLPGLPTEEGLPRIWGLPVVTTPNLTVNDYLCGAFPGNCALFDRESVSVEMAFQNEDDFVRNLITIRAEERVALAVFVPKAFASGPFLSSLLVAPAGASAAASPTGEPTGANLPDSPPTRPGQRK